ncbi:hypothetical protein EAH79_06770 [Sphingomonas koreensis]|nr:hypothetical protein EAH79_06770 [Sphingomonas koreensis]
MKLILMAAAVAFAVPAMAQTTTDDQTQTDTSATDDTMAAPDPAMQTQDQTAPDASDQSMAAPAPAPAMAGDPAGGYAPSTPPMSGPATPGANVVFQPSASPSQAFPPPAPLASYPTCKRGQTDKCIEAHSPK